MKAKNTVEKLLLLIDNWAGSIIMLASSFLFAAASSRLLHFSPKNTYSIENDFVKSGFNPEINFIKVLWIALVTVAVFLLLKYIYSKSKNLAKALFVLFLAISFLCVYIAPSATSYYGNIDTFHHGEQLSPALAHQQGKELFTDIFFLHGAGEDVLLPQLSFQLSKNGQHIGSYYFVTAILQFVSALLFIGLIAIIIKPFGLFAFASSWFFISAYSSFHYIRDIPVWLVIALLFYYFTKKLSDRNKLLIIFSICSISSLVLFYSMDRGIFLLVLSMIFLAINGIVTRDKNKALYKLSTINKPQIIKVFTGLLALLVTQLLGLVILGFSQYKEFIKMTFIDIPKYVGLMFNYPLPNLNSATYLIWLPFFVMALTGLILFYIIIKEYGNKKTFGGDTIFGLIFFIFSVVFLRAGVGRIEMGHIAYSAPSLFLSAFFIVYLALKKFPTANVKYLWMPLLSIAILFVPISTFDFNRALAIGNFNLQSIKRLIKLPSENDDKFLPEHVKEVSNFVKSKTSSEDYIFVFTNQPIYYYLTQRNNPSRFYITWFADPQAYSDELFKDLQANPPKIVIYASGTNWDNPDGPTVAEMLPEVDKWITENYPYTVTIQPVTLKCSTIDCN